jgi:hypothetical protein
MSHKAQNLIAISMSLVGSVMLFLIINFPNRIIFLTSFLIGFALLILGERFLCRVKKIERGILPILLTTVFSFISLISIIEWDFLNWPFIILIGFIILILMQSIVSIDKGFLHIQQKPYRRIMVLIWSFDVYAMVATIFGLSLFFPIIPFWILTLICGAIFGLISFMVWRMYFDIKFKQTLVWVFLISFLMIELVWVIHLLPFGYLVSGFFITWLWYILQLLVRFHFSSKGVVWKKQIWFLLSNFLLYIFLLVFFVRWV